MHMRAVEHTIRRGLCTQHDAWVNHTENRCERTRGMKNCALATKHQQLQHSAVEFQIPRLPPTPYRTCRKLWLNTSRLTRTTLIHPSAWKRNSPKFAAPMLSGILMYRSGNFVACCT